MEIIDQKILHDSVRWPLDPKYKPAFPGEIKKEESAAGDIVIANEGGDKRIIKQSEYTTNSALYTENGYQPIAVVVVPASHTDDGTARCMSLKYMSADGNNNAEVGSDIIYNINWGSSNEGRLIEGVSVISTFNVPIPGTSSFAVSDTWPTPSDNEKWNQPDVENSLNVDPIARKLRTVYGTSSGLLVASPYGADGVSKNEIYFGLGQVGHEMNGKENTEYIVEYGATSAENGPEWRDDLRNYAAMPNYFPAAYSCYLYHTTGTQLGDWYLPAIGELWYLMPRSNEIRKALLKIGISDLSPYLGLVTWGVALYTSTQTPDLNRVWECHLANGAVMTTIRNAGTLLSAVSFIKI